MEAMLAEFRGIVRDLAASYQRGGMTEDAAKAKAFEEGFESALTGWADCIRRSGEKDQQNADLKLVLGAAAKQIDAEEKKREKAETERNLLREVVVLQGRPPRKKRNTKWPAGTIRKFWNREEEWTGKDAVLKQAAVAESVLKGEGLPSGKQDVNNFIRAAQARRQTTRNP